MKPPRWMMFGIEGKGTSHARCYATINWRDWQMYREALDTVFAGAPWQVSLRVRWLWLKAQFGWRPGGGLI